MILKSSNRDDGNQSMSNDIGSTNDVHVSNMGKDNDKNHLTLRGRIYVSPFNPFWQIQIKKSNDNTNTTTAPPDWIVVQQLIRDSYNIPEISTAIFSHWTLLLTVYLLVCIILILNIFFVYFLLGETCEGSIVGVCILEGGNVWAVPVFFILFMLFVVYVYYQYHQQILAKVLDDKFFLVRFVLLSIWIWLSFDEAGIQVMCIYWILEGFKMAIPYGIVVLVQWYNRSDKVLAQVHYASKEALSERQDIYCRLKINYDYKSIAIDVYTDNSSSLNMAEFTLCENDPNIFSYEAVHPLLFTTSDMDVV